MYLTEPSLEPPVDHWEEYEKPIIVESKIHDICVDIVKRGSKTQFQNIYDIIYEHIIDRFEDFV